MNHRIRDAVFSRQRYWGEPFPIKYENGIATRITGATVTLPKVDAYLPTEDGEPPLARAAREDWPVFRGDAMETNTMPGWAGSSWYFPRYMDPHNKTEFCARDKSDYWGQGGPACRRGRAHHGAPAVRTFLDQILARPGAHRLRRTVQRDDQPS